MTFMSGLEEIIKKSFISVFDGINATVEFKKEMKVFLAGSSELFAKWIIDNYSHIPLFATNRSAPVNELHVKLLFTSEISREKYKSDDEIEKELIARDMVKGFAAHQRSKALDICKVVNTSVTKTPATDEKGNQKYGENKLPIYESKQFDIAILGSAGSGKTTSLKYLMFLAAKGHKFRNIIRIPFFIELRALSIKNGFILNHIVSSLDALGFKYSEKIAKKIIREGKCLILIDGLDELMVLHQRIVMQEIHSLRKLCNNKKDDKNIICLTGRPYSLTRELSGFIKYDVLDMDAPEKERLINNWYSEVSPKKGIELIRILREDGSLNSITRSPFMLSIICALYFNEHHVSGREDEVIRSCIEGLMGKWDLFRSITRDSALFRLTIPKRTEVLVELAGPTFIPKRKIILRENDAKLNELVGAIKDRYKINESVCAEGLLRSLYNDFGVLNERAPGAYTFSHLKFQEYLAARWLVENRKSLTFLTKITDDPMVWEFILIYILRNERNPEEYLLAILKILKLNKTEHIYLVYKILNDNDICLPSQFKKKFVRIVVIDKFTKLVVGKEVYAKDNSLIIFLGYGVSAEDDLVKQASYCWELIYKNFSGNLTELLSLLPQLKSIGYVPRDLRFM